VQLDAGHEIVAYTAASEEEPDQDVAGDRVTIEMSPYDLEKGRLIFRHKDERPSTGAPRGAPPPAASSAAGNRLYTRAHRARHTMSRATAAGWPADQKIVHVRIGFGPPTIILGIDFRPDDISYPPVQPV